MKNYIKVIFLLIVMFILSSNVVAVEEDTSAYTCIYKIVFSGSSVSEDLRAGSLEFDPGEETIKGKDMVYLLADNFVYDSLNENNIKNTLEALKVNNQYVCPSQIYACQGFPANSIVSYPVALIFFVNGDLYENLPEGDDGKVSIAHGLSAYSFQKNENCEIADFVAGSRPENNVKFVCTEFLSYVWELKNLYCNLGSDSDCKVEDIEEYNAKKNEFIGYCRAKSSYVDYLNPCGQSCLNIKSTIAEIEGTSTTDNGNNCGFSERIVVFINNILKWVKYIIPAIVVVLGIIDFIKAIVSDKDDEMKKAQGRFVKRLIAAALIFIIPFIIGFILDKMGFTAESCGIIKELE